MRVADGLKVLVVDDSEAFCRNLSDILEMGGHTVATACSGAEALKLAAAQKLDLVLMDVRMPQMDGVAAFKRMKLIAPDVPVIMVTAHSVEDQLREALREGAFGVLKKPLDFDLLFEVIHQASGRGGLLLVADDDRDLCANLKDILGGRGYRVAVALNGDAALVRAQQNNFDVMLLDLKLPPVNGLETYLAIRDIRPKVVVVVISGYPQETGDLAKQALDSGAYAYLPKPLDIGSLLLLLQQVRREKTAPDGPAENAAEK